MDAKTAALLTLTVGSAIFGFFGWTLVKDIYKFLWLKRNGVMAEGTVVDVKEVKYDDIVYHPIIEFETEYHIRVRFTSADSSSRMPEIGEQLVILYDPNNPERAVKYESKMFWSPFLILLFISSILIFLWIGLLTAKTVTWGHSDFDCILPTRLSLF